MNEFLRHRARTIGLAPGSLQYVGAERSDAARLRLTSYDCDEIEETRPRDAEEALTERGRRAVTWIEIEGVHDTMLVATLGQALGLHPLLQEDIVHIHQRPGLTEEEDVLFCTLRLFEYQREPQKLRDEQVSLVLAEDACVSFLEGPSKVFDAPRQRLAKPNARLRRSGPDMLFVSLLDAVVDGYLEALSLMAEDLEDLEADILEEPGPESQARLQHFRRQAVGLRRALWPLREVLNLLLRLDSPLLGEQVLPYVRDVSDHVHQALEAAEMLRDSLEAMADSLLAALSHRQNQVMNLLTMVATIFIPLSFLAGVYGMNFRYMPELDWRYGYFILLGLMAALALGMLTYFRRRGWI